MIELIHPDKNKEDRVNSDTQSEAVMRSKQGELSKIKPGREAGYPTVDATSNKAMAKETASSAACAGGCPKLGKGFS